MNLNDSLSNLTTYHSSFENMLQEELLSLWCELPLSCVENILDFMDPWDLCEQKHWPAIWK